MQQGMLRVKAIRYWRHLSGSLKSVDYLISSNHEAILAKNYEFYSKTHVIAQWHNIALPQIQFLISFSLTKLSPKKFKQQISVVLSLLNKFKHVFFWLAYFYSAISRVYLSWFYKT